MIKNWNTVRVRKGEKGKSLKCAIWLDTAVITGAKRKIVGT